MTDTAIQTTPADTQSLSAKFDVTEPKTWAIVKSTFLPTATAEEANMFFGIAKATSLNPFLKEIWFVKYGGRASIFIGRDGYRKGSQASSEYDYHQVDAVYENDAFEVKNGEVSHSYSLKDRGKLVGAYCIVQRKSASKPMFNFVSITEYDAKQGNWSKMPATMIKKVAEAQGLRGAFQQLFANTYDESEDWKGKEEGVTKATFDIQPLLDRINTAQTREVLEEIKKDFLAGQVEITPTQQKKFQNAWTTKYQELKPKEVPVEDAKVVTPEEKAPELVVETPKAEEEIPTSPEVVEELKKEETPMSPDDVMELLGEKPAEPNPEEISEDMLKDMRGEVVELIQKLNLTPHAIKDILGGTALKDMTGAQITALIEILDGKLSPKTE